MILPALGIDISKRKFDVCIINADGKLRHKQFLNTASGFDQLAAWLTKQQVTNLHACLEATGTYGEALAYHLHAAGHHVSVLNPAAVKAFAASRLSRTKTDRVDAELIARFCVAQQPPAWTPPAAEVRELQALVRRLEDDDGRTAERTGDAAAAADVPALRGTAIPSGRRSARQQAGFTTHRMILLVCENCQFILHFYGGNSIWDFD